MAHESNRAVNDVLQNRFHPPALNIDFLRRECGACHHFLPEGSKQVECDHGAKQDGFIDAEFTRWQPFNIHIAFKLAVKLLAGAVVMIKTDHGFCLAGQVRPSCVYFDGWNQQIKALGIFQTFDHFKGDGYRRAVFIVTWVAK